LGSDERGFRLVELLIVLIVIGILVAIAIPSYLGFRDRAEQRAAAANVRAAVPAVETYFSDQSPHTSIGMDIPALQLIDLGVRLSAVSGVTDSSYCISSTVGTKTWRKVGPGGAIAEGASC
jgi:prepilin-type N-terminal cleavage/methylation domain-containing protein